MIERERLRCNQHRLNKRYTGAVKEGEKTIYSIYGHEKEIIITKNDFCFQEYYPLDIQLMKLDKIYDNIMVQDKTQDNFKIYDKKQQAGLIYYFGAVLH